MSPKEKERKLPPQHQSRQPGRESLMHPQPASRMSGYRPADKLKGKRALITGGDSGIGRAVAIAFAKEGADVALAYLDEHEDAGETCREIEKEGRKSFRIAADIGDAEACARVVRESAQALEGIDILVNNAAEQHAASEFEGISPEQIERTFRTNILSQFFMTQHCLKYLEENGGIINSSSVTAYRGSGHLIDYASTKGAIIAFTRSLAKSLAPRNIRVNAVAPGPVWTPLIPASFEAEKVETFGGQVPMERAGQPDEIAPCYVFLASGDSSYMTGQVLHPNGGEVIGA